MVFYSNSARTDLKSIFDGLLTWSKHKLEFNHVALYHNDILVICNGLDSKTFHFNTQFPFHKRLGEKVHNYRRNKQTNWYIIYNLDPHGNVYI
ncbi:MAG: hypothetical protein ACOYMD_14840, partial [Paludibacter sp.]